MILSIKRNSKGTVSRSKARLVAGGQMQRKGDYVIVSTPTIEFPTVMFFLNYILLHGLHHKHIDVETAFLNGTLDEEIYIRLQKHISSK